MWHLLRPAFQIKRAWVFLYHILINGTHLEYGFPLNPTNIITGVEQWHISILLVISHILHGRTDCVTMSSRASPIAAGLFLHSTESKALAAFRSPPQIYGRYMNDTSIFIESEYRDKFHSITTVSANRLNLQKTPREVSVSLTAG